MANLYRREWMTPATDPDTFNYTFTAPEITA